jgi:hypothetical protein
MRLRFLAPLIVLLAACQGSDNLLIGPPEVWVAADVSPVRRDPASGDAVVSLRVLNDRRSSVYLEACGERPTVAVERRLRDVWVSANAPVCPAIYLGVPIEVEGRSSRPFTVTLREPGAYRVVVSASSRAERADFHEVASDVFQVE